MNEQDHDKKMETLADRLSKEPDRVYSIEHARWKDSDEIENALDHVSAYADELAADERRAAQIDERREA